HRYFRPENTIIAVVGDIDPSKAIEEIRTRFASWKGEGAWKAPAVIPATRQTEPRPVTQSYKAQQARIHLGHVGIERKNPALPALRVMEMILLTSPGFTNRLARNVRDLQGLAYDVNGSITGGAGGGVRPLPILPVRAATE